MERYCNRPALPGPLPLLTPWIPVILAQLASPIETFTLRGPPTAQFHVIGDLVVTPFTLLSATLAELDRVVAACGNRRIFILAILPRYFLKPCCDDITHCANVCRHDESAVEAGKKLLRDLEALNEQLAARYNGRNTQFIFTGDLLTGKNRSSMGELVDSLFECWRSDPVHGDKSAYIKLAMGLMDFLDPKPDSRIRK